MVSARKMGGRTAAQRYAACVGIFLGVGFLGLGAPGIVHAQGVPEVGFAPNPPPNPLPPAAYVPAAPPPAAAGARAAGPARGRGITRAEFIERRREAAARKGRDPERAAANAGRQFDLADTNHDGIVDPPERAAFEAAHPDMRRGRGQNQ